MAGRKPHTITVRLTANFERNLAEIEDFLAGADAAHAFGALLDELTDTVIPNLERFPAMGRDFLRHSVGSVEGRNGLEDLRVRLAALGENAAIMEYILQHYLVLYAHVGTAVYLLSIRHHRQLSFDLASHWEA